MDEKRIARFWSYVDRRGDDECWPWIGWVNGKEKNKVYGRFFIGQVDGKDKYIMAHRLAYELCVGPISEGLVPDHLCRNTLCVNPRHIEPVTRRENTLRGETIPAKYSQRTHCDAGHELTGDNLYDHSLWKYPTKAARLCKICRRQSSKDRYHRRKQNAAQSTGA